MHEGAPARKVSDGMKLRRAMLAAAAVVGLLGPFLGSAASTATAQGWWPWATPQEPRPREPVYKGPPPAPIPGQPGLPPGYNPPPGGQYARPGQAGNICLQLEQRLVAETQRGGSSRETLARIDNDFRLTERQLAQAQSKVDRGDCYEYFLFAKSVRNTPECRNASVQVDTLRRKMSELDGQRRQIVGTGDQRHQDDIIRELARNGCGQQYVQQARKLDSQAGGFWSSDEDNAPRGGNQFGSLPFATYRTVCVRLCDGFYFPVSFSTLPNHFPQDAEVCQARCAAPVELFYHQNPGGGMEQAVSAKSQTNYTALKTAFRYRKEFVQGCSCKEAEYLPAAGEKKADAGAGHEKAAVAASPRQARVP
jgi:hypothetical protein